MLHHALGIAAVLAALATSASCAYYLLCLVAAFRFARDQQDRAVPGQGVSLPGVSILKPLKGTDPEMYESLRSHCLQDYARYEIIFGVSNPQDPAIDLVKKLRNEFPSHEIRLAICGKDLGPNTKVGNLAQMLPLARYDHVLVNDSDIRVESDYLRRVILALMKPDVGLVTCLYRGVAAGTLGSKLEALGISTDFCAGVLVARLLEGVRFGLGSTLAIRRKDLEQAAGFEALVDYLADDYEVGNRIAAQGKQVVIADPVVETFLPSYGFSDFFRHQTRWARSIRDSRPSGYVGLGITFGLPWAVLTLLCAGGATWAVALLLLALLLRGAVALAVGTGILKDRSVMPRLVLLPLRDFTALLLWIVSFAGHTIWWRGECFRLEHGKLVRASKGQS